MTVTNFKSFKGAQKVGPFNNFTSIVGPNGAGKSCVLKAISFCLALKVPDMNKDNFAYIRNKEVKPTDQVSVEIAFNTKLNDTLFLKRTMGAKDKDEGYFINSKTVSKIQYREFIAEQRIDVHAGIFIFGQGFSDTLIMKNPQELRDLFEVISNAYEFRRECEDLEVQIKKHQEDFDRLADDLKNLNKQKKLVSAQLTNSDHFNKISNNYDRLELDQVLSCLLELDLKVKNSNAQITSLTDKVTEDCIMHDRLAKELKSNQSQTSQAKDKRDQAESELLKKQQDLAFSGEQRLQAQKKKEQMVSLQKSLEGSLSTLVDRLRDIAAQKEAIEAEITKAEKEIEKLAASEKLPAETEKHYQALVKSTLGFQLEKPEESQARNEEKRLATLQDRYTREYGIVAKESKDLEISLSLLDKKIDLKTRNLHDEQKNLKVYQKEYSQVQDKLANIAEAQRVMRGKQDEVAEINLAIDNFKFKLGEQKNQDELTQKLYNNVEGFRGELGNLIKPVSERYALALSLALGKAKKYLVVKDEKAANLTNDILKEKFMSRTVVILQNIPSVKNNEIQSFRAEIGQLGAAAYDIAEFEKGDKDIEPCLRYFLRGKAVCETLEKAHKLRAQQGRKARIFTIGGEQLRETFISSSGNTDAQREEFATKMAINMKIDDLRQRKEILEMEIKSSAGIDDVQNSDLLRERINTLTNIIKQLQIEIESLKDNRIKLKREFETKDASRKTKEVDLQDVATQHSRVSAQLDTFKEHRREILRGRVLEYSNKNKVKDAQKLVEVFLDKIEATVDRELDLRQTINSKRRQIEDLGLQEAQAKVSQAQNNLDNYVRMSSENDKELNQVEKKCELLRADIELLVKDKDTTKQKYLQSIENETKLRSHLREISDEIDIFRSAVRNYETEFQSCLRRKTQLIEDKSLEGMTIPLKKGEGSQAITKTARRLGEAASANVDYSSLVQRVKSGAGGIIREEAEFEDEEDEGDATTMFTLESISEIKKFLTTEFDKSVKELNSLSTKFVTDDTIDREKKKLSELVEKISEAKQKVDDVRDGKTFRENELKKYKDLRNSRFMDVFTYVSVRIKDVYRRLNRNDTADAYLTLESPNDPCQGGVIFNPTPPNKKYIFEAASLSGGEKALASLALYFSINDVLKSPFLLLDEADAALDKYNVALVQAYLKGLSKSRQVITVSHNSWFIRRSSMLLGVTKLPQINGSSCFSFDLDLYRNAENNEEIEA